jgi:hypothetical protein
MTASDAEWRVRFGWEDPQLTLKTYGVTRVGELKVLWA